MSVNRLESKRHRGWQARIRRPRGSVPADRTKYFADRAHGGSRAAKAAAARWERQERRRLGLPNPPTPPEQAGAIGGRRRAKRARRRKDGRFR